jgi:ribonuclease III
VKQSLLANAMEALIAALYLDGGMDAARRFVQTHVYSDQPLLDAEGEEHRNFKGELWELATARKLPRPEYTVTATAGPAHAPSFEVKVKVGEEITGNGTGPSKKAAEQSAAQSALDALTPPAAEPTSP